MMFTDETTRRRAVAAALPTAMAAVDGVVPSHRGKVRDVFQKNDEVLLVATDRVSAFDVVLGTIPLKGTLLTEQSVLWLNKASDIAKTHLIERTTSQSMRCHRAQAFPVELVVRGYLAGSLMREPPERRGRSYGLVLDPAQAPYTPFAAPIITPTTKEQVGTHDEPCALDDLVRGGRISRAHLDRVCEIALALFAMGSAHANDNGLILVDTKYEFGVIDGEVAIIDEVHTADSSRFWLKDSYAQRLADGAAPDMLDKEVLRRWLLERGFSGEGAPPPLTDDIRAELAVHSWHLTERVLGQAITPAPTAPAAVLDVVKAFQER